MSRNYFPVKTVAELIPLTFDFTKDLPPGVTLQGTPTVTVELVFGSDATPDNIKNGSPAIDTVGTSDIAPNKSVIVPSKAGVSGCHYRFNVLCPTTNPLLTLELEWILPVYG